MGKFLLYTDQLINCNPKAWLLNCFGLKKVRCWPFLAELGYRFLGETFQVFANVSD